MTDTIQTVHLADNINAAFNKINENFEGITDGTITLPVSTLADLDDVTLTSLSNGEVLKWDGSVWTNQPDGGGSGGDSFSFDTSAIDSDINANTSAILALESHINQTDSGVTVLSQIVASTQAQLDSMVLDGIDSDLLASAIASATSTLISRIDADSDKLVIEAANILDLETGLIAQNSDLSSQISAVSNAQSSLVSRTEFDSAEGRITTLASDVVALNSQVDITNPDGSLSQAVADTKSTLRGEITVVDGRITSVETSLTNTLNAKIDSDIAEATETLTALIDSAGNTVATWGIDLVAGTEDNPKVAGIKFGNDGTAADFAITTDTFKILPTDGTGNGTAPFSVVDGVVEMSGAKVTGELDVTTSDASGSMNITGNLITISDGSGNPRVKLGKL